jgi:hypothetical protein
MRFFDSGVVMLGSCRCGAVLVEVLKLSRRVKEARRVAIHVYWLLKNVV